MENNTDLRILEKRVKTFKFLTVTFAILTPLPLLGVGLKFPYSYIFVALSALLFIAAITFSILMRLNVIKTEKTVNYLKTVRDNLIAANSALDGYLTATYANIDCKECGDMGYVNFARENLGFSAEGRFAVEKDFKGIKGNYLALQIRGTQLVSTPEDYDDVLDYESNLFTLNLGYFEDCPFTEENDTGLILPDGDIKGKAIRFSSDGGYVCNFDTAETDDIDRGELVISQLSDDSLTLSFKCLVGCGAAEVVYGKVTLTREKQVLN